jgi:hypothetical protein
MVKHVRTRRCSAVKVMKQLFALVLLSACTIGPFDMTELRQPGDLITFTGYTYDPSMAVNVVALDQATGTWVQIASTTSSPSATVAPNTWYSNPALYRWTVSTRLTNPCFFNAACTIPTGDYGESVVRVRARQSDGFELIVFHDDYFSCMGELMAGGSDFHNAAVSCRSWSYPDLRLRVVGEWWRLPVTTQVSPPAIAALPRVVSVIASNGSTLQFSNVTGHGQIGAWTQVDGVPGQLATDVAPAVASTPDDTLKRAIVRRTTGRLATTSMIGSWQPMRSINQVTNANPGRVSAALGSSTLTHIAHVGPPGMVAYWRLDGADLDTATASGTMFGGSEAVVGSRGPDHALLVVRLASSLQVFTFSSADAWTPRLLGTLSTGAIDDLSEVVYYGSQYHFVYSRPMGNGYSELVHASAGASVSTRQAATWLTNGPASVALGLSRSRGLDAVGALTNVHAHMIATWRDNSPGLQTARWDRSQASVPWRREPTVGATNVVYGRPVLAGAPMTAELDLARAPGFGNDVFVAMRGADQGVRLANLTRGMMRRDVERKFELFDYPLRDLCSMASGETRSTANATWMEDLAANDRPIISELGALDWTLPAWFTDEVFQAAGRQQCERGERQVDTDATGRPCSMEKLPVVVKNIGGLFVCPDGAYINHDSSVTGAWDEIGHIVAGVMGFHDSAVGPTARDADVTDISLAALQTGYSLFGQALGGCTDASRCPGFTRIYDTGSRQHSFIYAVYAYIFSGNMMRTWILQDLNRLQCNDLLARKYLWIRSNLYPGVEFDDRGEPLAAPRRSRFAIPARSVRDC